MESSMYWLDLIAETYIGICMLCCLFIISKQRRRPAPMMRVMLLVWPIITLWAGPLGIWAYETSNRRMPSHDGDGGARAWHVRHAHGNAHATDAFTYPSLEERHDGNAPLRGGMHTCRLDRPLPLSHGALRSLWQLTVWGMGGGLCVGPDHRRFLPICRIGLDEP